MKMVSNSTFLKKYQEMTHNDPSIALKEEVKSILRDYRNFWDVHAELIQNSVDSINRRFKLLNDTSYHLYDEFHETYPNFSDANYSGKIEIQIDTRDKTLTVLDNGVGIDSESMIKFLLPKASGKKIKHDYGFKGYGLTFVAFISRFFSITSKPFTTENSYGYEISNIFDWLISDSLPFPNFPDQASLLNDPDMNNWNTKISIRYDDDYQRRFDAVAALDLVNDMLIDETDLEKFEYILRTKTAVGNTKILFSQPPLVAIDIKLNVIFPDGKISNRSLPYSYYHPVHHSEISVNTFEFANYVTQSRAANFTRGFRGLTHKIKAQTIGQRTPLVADIHLSAVSATRLGNIEKELRLDTIEDPGAKISCGIYLSIDGMPTGIRLDSWDKKGGQYKRYYVIVDCSLDISNTLDSGRKGITSHYANLIDAEVIRLLNTSQIEGFDTFSSYSSRDLDIGRGTPLGNNGFTVPEFQSDIRNAKAQHDIDLISFNEQVLKVNKYSPLLSIPHSEQEVVALFYSLLSQNIIKGYKTVYQAGSEKVYDASYTYELDLEDNTEPLDSLGIGRIRAQELKSEKLSKYDHSQHFAYRTVYPEICVEFKLTIGGLLNELSRQSNKDSHQIDLLIVWDTSVPPQIQGDRYTLVEVNPTQRLFHSTTHLLGIINARNTDIFVISLKDVLDKLI